jgi:DNA-binding NarL/FixJ family response regulator
MVVDDAPILRKNISFILTQNGHEVVAEAENGTQAIMKYGIHNPDLVTMDVSMPYTSGIEALVKIRAKFPDAKVIMISTESQKNLVLQALKSGAKNFIIKPVIPEKLIEVVNAVLASK